MPILTSGNEPDLSDVGSLTAVPAIIRQLGPVEEPPAKGLHYRMARQLRAGESAARPQGGPPRQVIINVGGLRFSMPWATLDEGCPSERLGRLRSCSSHDDLMALCDDYDVARGEFFFDRHPAAFGAIAACLRAGKLRVSRGTCALAFREELAYWGVDEARLEWCCRRRLYQKQEEEAEAMRHLEEMETQEGQQAAAAAAAGGMDDDEDAGEPASTRAARRLSWLMARLRDMVEDPSSGLPGKIFAFLSVVFVAITAVSLCISTMPDLRAEEDKGECSQKCHDIFVVETVCVGWFSFEFLLRLVQSRSKWRFLRDPLNVIDVAAILPYYVTLIVDSVSDGRPPSLGSTNIYLEKVGLVLRVLRALRILYVMRLARHSLGLQTLGLTIRRCTRELGLLLLFLCVAMALFAPMVYLAENELVIGGGGGGGGGDGGTSRPPADDAGIGGGGGVNRAHEFTSIPACYWWAIISMTTVGYGDMVPRSIAGQVVALSSILSGILLMAFPVTSIFHTFSRSYVELKEGQLRNLHLKHRVALLKAQATSSSLDSSQYSEPLAQRVSLIPSG